MNRTARFLLTLSLVIMISFPLFALAENPRCAECGMMVDMQSRFAARIAQEGSTLSFCDIGDLLSYLKRKGPQQPGAEVQDYISGKWMDARKALYVQAEKKFRTPMGWGVAAFEDRTKALENGAAMDFDAMIKALK